MTPRTRLGAIALVALAAACGGGGETDQTVPKPAAATGLAGSVVGPAEVLLTWTDVATNETGYRIERSVDGGPFAPLGLELAPNSVSFVDAACVAGSSYAYRVVALGVGGNVASATVTVPFLVAVAPTGGGAAATSSSTIQVTWTNVATDAVALTVYRSTDGTTFAEVASLDPDATSHDDSALTASTLYYYRVTATNLVGESAGYASASATTQAPPVVLPNAAPTGLAAGSPTASSVPLTWACAATNEDGFRIFWSTTNVKPASPGATVGANATSGTATGLAASTTYYFWVAAYNVVGESAAAGSVTATTLPPPPAAPTNFTGAPYPALKPTSIRFTWTDNSNNETGFRVEAKPVACALKGTYATLCTAAANGTTCSEPLTSFVSGRTYCFRACAYNASGASCSTTLEATAP